MQAIPVTPGVRFGRLIILGPAGVRNGETMAHVRCDCGTEKDVTWCAVRKGVTSSCGCLRKERAREGTTKHGLTAGGRANWHPLYAAWLTMKSRCYNKNFPKYKDYGGRGIKVCARWRDDFATFLADVGERPAPGMSLDRKNNDGDYEPNNVRWATPKQQSANRRPQRARR